MESSDVGISKKSLTQIIKTGLLREPKQSAHRVLDGFTCGRPYLYKGPNGDDSGRFCSPRCREGFDNGAPPYDPTYAHKTNPRWYSLPIGPHGFFIDCVNCGKRFDSKGLRCCSTKCERKYHAAEKRAERQAPSLPHCEVCGRSIARSGHRRSPVTVRFCSDTCRKRHARSDNLANVASCTQNRDLSARSGNSANNISTLESSPQNWPTLREVIEAERIEPHSWRPSISSGGVKIEVARLRSKPLKGEPPFELAA